MKDPVFKKQNKQTRKLKKKVGVAQVVEHLPSNNKTLSSQHQYHTKINKS
jgi:hypothetical protein